MKVNLNSRVKVKLTPSGRETMAIYYSQFVHIPDSKAHVDEKQDKEGFISFHLWEIFQIFGQHIHMGMPEVPFEDNALDIVELI